jgi:WD40 repeat protein
VKQFATFPRIIDDMTFSPDGKLFAAVDTKGVFMVWDLATSRLLTTLQVPEAAYSRNTEFTSFNGVQFSRDGKKLVATSANGVAVWDTQHHQPFVPSFVEPNYLAGTDISPDGSQMAIGWAGGPLTFLSFDSTSWQAQACEIANRNLTNDEWSQLIGTDPPYRKLCANLP